MSLLGIPSFLVSPAGGILLTTAEPESLDNLHKMHLGREKTSLLLLIFAYPHLQFGLSLTCTLVSAVSFYSSFTEVHLPLRYHYLCTQFSLNILKRSTV